MPNVCFSAREEREHQDEYVDDRGVRAPVGLQVPELHQPGGEGST